MPTTSQSLKSRAPLRRSPLAAWPKTKQGPPHGLSLPGRTEQLSLQFPILFLAGHALLAIAMHKLPVLATTHAWLSFGLACYIALSAKDQTRVVFAVAYLGASEVLWRMTNAGVFWEFGKYAVATVLLLSLSRRRPPRWNWLAVAYILLLIPSTVLSCFETLDIFQIKRLLSFNLTGPFSLAVCTFCLYRARLTGSQAQRLLLMMLGPLTGVAAICLFATAHLAGDYEFNSESNFDITGGFGPNQVSAMLGLATLLAFLWTQISRESIQRSLGVVLVLLYFALAALTFSRTGVWIGVATILTAGVFLVRDRRRFLSGLATLLILSVFGYCVAYPMLDSFTGGKLSERFQEKGFAGREEIAKSDLQMFLRHPVLGVGLGMAMTVRARDFGIKAAAHTEFTRLLAEHGFLGLFALGALLLMGLQTLSTSRSPFGRAWNASLLAYAILFMMVSGMRLVAPALALGLAMLNVASPDVVIRRIGSKPVHGNAGGVRAPASRAFRRS